MRSSLVGALAGAVVAGPAGRAPLVLPRRAPPAGRRSMLGTKLPQAAGGRGPTGARCLPQPECGGIIWHGAMVHAGRTCDRFSSFPTIIIVVTRSLCRISSSHPHPLSDLSSAAGALARRGFRGRVLTLERRVLADSLLVKLPNVCERSGQLSKRIRGSARVLCTSHGRYAC